VTTAPETDSEHERAPPPGALLVWNGMVTRLGIARRQDDATTPTGPGEDTTPRRTDAPSTSSDAEGVRVP
jgi:hypothetical protein